MSSKMYVIRTVIAGGLKPVAEVTVSDDGSANVVVLEHSAFMDSLQNGIGSKQLSRKVLPAEGYVFIEAIQDELRRSSQWSIVAHEEDSLGPGLLKG